MAAWNKERTANTMAVISAVGFFLLIFVVLLGFVDVTNPSVSTLVGTALGYASSKLETVYQHYFGAGRNEKTPAAAVDTTPTPLDDEGL